MRMIVVSLMLCASLSLHAQSTYIQLGGIASFYQYGGTALGGGADINFQTKKNLVLGGGIAAMLFERDAADGAYLPLFARAGYAITAKTIVITFYGDAGYGLHHSRDPFLGANISEGGGFYAAPGVSVHVNNRFSPVIGVRYSIYNFKITVDSETSHFQYRGPSVFVGLCLLHKK